MRNSRLACMAEPPASEAGAEAVPQACLTEIAAVGPQADEMVLAATGDCETDLEFGVTDPQPLKSEHIRVCLQEMVDGVGRIARQSFQFALPSPGTVGVAQV